MMTRLLSAETAVLATQLPDDYGGECVMIVNVCANTVC